MKEPKKAFVKIIYSDFSSEEIEIPLDIAMKITDKEKESDLMSLVSGLDLSACSKRRFYSSLQQTGGGSLACTGQR